MEREMEMIQDPRLRKWDLSWYELSNRNHIYLLFPIMIIFFCYSKLIISSSLSFPDHFCTEFVMVHIQLISNYQIQMYTIKKNAYI